MIKVPYHPVTSSVHHVYPESGIKFPIVKALKNCRFDFSSAKAVCTIYRRLSNDPVRFHFENKSRFCILERREERWERDVNFPETYGTLKSGILKLL
jgi:hypothetical protein